MQETNPDISREQTAAASAPNAAAEAANTAASAPKTAPNTAANAANPASPAAAAAPFPSLTDLLVLLGLFFVVSFAVGLAAIVVLLLSGRGLDDLDPYARARLLALSNFLSLSVLTAAFLWYRSRRRAPRLRIGYGLHGLDFRLLGAAFVLMCALSVLLEPLYTLLPAPDQNVGRGPWAFAAVVVIAPLFEEWLCRGFLFGSLRERFGVGASCLLSALFFGIIHAQPVPAVNAFFLGLILAWIYERTATLWAPILLHAAHNLLAWLLTVGGYGDSTLPELLGGRMWLYALCYAAAAVAALGALGALFRMRHRSGGTRTQR